MSLLDLPNEILISTAVYLDANSLNSLLRTNLLLSKLCTPLLHNLATDDKDGLPAICWAAQQGHEPLVRILLEKGISYSARGPSIMNGRSFYSRPGMTALGFAAVNRNMGIMRILLKHSFFGVNGCDESGCSLLASAVRSGNIGICRLLLGAGVNPDVYHESIPILQWAILGGANEVLIRLLLKHGAKINKLGSCGKAALHIAVLQKMDQSHQLSLVKLLLDEGAEINIRTGTDRDNHSSEKDDEPCGVTPLHKAVYKPHLAKLLIERGADPNIADESGNTPLHNAVYQPDLIKLLIERGADPNIADENGNTPLHFAVLSGETDVVSQLLCGGASVDIKNSNGSTPISLAKRMTHPNITLLLEGAKKPVKKH